MANVLVNETSLEDIADAIRAKNGTQNKYKPAQMADAISAISGGGITPTGTKTINITQNGTVTEDVTNYANAQVNVNVPTGTTPTGTKNISITQNGTTTEDVTNYASASIAVNVPNSYSASDEGKVVDDGALVSQTSATYTENDTYDTTLINEVVVNVASSGSLPAPITNFVTGTFTLASNSETIQINHGLGNYPTIIFVYPTNFDFVTLRTVNKGVTVTVIYNNRVYNGQLTHRYIHGTSGNVLSNAVQPLATNYQGNTATIQSVNASNPFPSKYHTVDDDEGTVIEWRWVALRLE